LARGNRVPALGPHSVMNWSFARGRHGLQMDLTQTGFFADVVPVVKIAIDRGDGKTPKALNISKHTVKKLLYKEVKKITKEMRTSNKGYEEDTKENK